MKADRWSVYGVLKLLRKIEDYNSTCPICGQDKIEKHGEWHQDHLDDCDLAWHIDKFSKEALNDPNKPDPYVPPPRKSNTGVEHGPLQGIILKPGDKHDGEGFGDAFLGPISVSVSEF
jgi:hypothetical protein